MGQLLNISSSCKFIGSGVDGKTFLDDSARNLVIDVVICGCFAVWRNLVVARFSGLVNLKNGNSLFNLKK